MEWERIPGEDLIAIKSKVEAVSWVVLPQDESYAHDSCSRITVMTWTDDGEGDCGMDGWMDGASIQRRNVQGTLTLNPNPKCGMGDVVQTLTLNPKP